MTDTSLPVKDAGNAWDEQGRFGFVPPVLKGSIRDAIWRRIQRVVGALREWPPHPVRTRKHEAFVELQALHLLVRAYRYGTMRLSLEVEDVLPLFGLRQGHLSELSRYDDLEHQARVYKLASRIALEEGEVVKATSLLAESEKREMESEFVPIRYAGKLVYFEREFAQQMLDNWNAPLLTTTAHAVETLHSLARIDLDIRRETRVLGEDVDDGTEVDDGPPFSVDAGVLRFVAGCYKEGRFQDPKDKRQDLYCTSSGIAIFKAARNLECNEHCETAEQFEELFPVSEWCGEIRRYAHNRLRELLRNPDSTTLIELNHAVRILRNMHGLPEFQVVMQAHRGDLAKFLLECRTEIDAPDGKLYAFKAGPSRSPVCLTACLAAARLVQHAGVSDAALAKHVEQCVPYVEQCRHPDDGGFGSSIRHVPDVLHTYMAVSFLAERRRQARSKGFDDGVFTPGIVRFLSQCHKSGGYSLLPEWVPSAYGTRLALQTYRKLGLPVPDRREMEAFIQSLLPRADGPRGYAGHPARPVVLAAL